MDHSQGNCNYILTVIAHSQLIKKGSTKNIFLNSFSVCSSMGDLPHFLKKRLVPHLLANRDIRSAVSSSRALLNL